MSKDAEELKKAAQEASRKLSEAAQEVVRQSLLSHPLPGHNI
jgi:hypothetical protein